MLRRLGLPTLVYAAATIYFTWPLPLTATDHIIDGGGGMWVVDVLRADLLLIIWILRWDMHALATDPLHIFNANAFHPAPWTLAGAEHMLGAVPLFAPIWWLTGNPVLAFNCLTFLSFVMAGAAMHVLVRKWTGSAAAAYVAGLAFAFAPWRIPDGLVRTQLLLVQYFPLILLGLDHTARTASMRAAVGTGLLITLQVLCSYYVGYQAFVLVGAFWGADLLGRGLRGRWRNMGALCLAVLVPVLLLVPASLPYVWARRSGNLGFEWTAAEVLAHTLGTPAFVARRYVGFGTLILGVLALPRLGRLWRSDHDAAVRMLALASITVAGFFFARGPAPILGSRLVLYDWIGAVVPGFGNIRAPVRFATIPSFGLSALSGFAVAGVLSWGRERVGRAFAGFVPAVAAVVVLVPMWAVPRLAGWRVLVGPAIPPVYHWLAEHGEGGPLLEVPTERELSTEQDAALAMYYSTYHWLPLLNGYAGYPPLSYRFLQHYAEQLPGREALQLLVDCARVRWIVVRPEASEPIRPWDALAGLRFRGAFRRPPWGQDRLYEVTVPPRGQCEGRLFQQGLTVDGHPVTPIGELDGTLDITDVPDGVAAGTGKAVVVTVENRGAITWPCTVVRPEGRVRLSFAWDRVDGDPGMPRPVLLPRDVGPGGRMEFSTWLAYPDRPGTYVLRAALAQTAVKASDAAPEPLRWERVVTVTAP